MKVLSYMLVLTFAVSGIAIASDCEKREVEALSVGISTTVGKTCELSALPFFQDEEESACLQAPLGAVKACQEACARERLVVHTKRKPRNCRLDGIPTPVEPISTDKVTCDTVAVIENGNVRQVSCPVRYKCPCGD